MKQGKYSLGEKGEMHMKLITERNVGVEIILDSITDAICIIDAEGITKYWNKGCEKLYGIKREDIIGRPITEFFPSAIIQRAIDERRPYENVYNVPREDSYNISSASPIYYDNELVGAISIDRDVTEFMEISKQLRKTRMNLQVLKEELAILNNAKSPFSSILGKNEKLRNAIKLAKSIANSNLNVLIRGESGTGKDLFARAIHLASGREGNYVPINCSAIPNELIESELFGYAGGAFTGALKEGKIGKIELSHKGTLFLDEIGDMPLHMQPKILRVIEDGEVTPVGSDKSIKVDIRVVAATNRDLEEMVEKGTFRKDLYYRLNSVIIEIPPLRERKDDIQFLANRFLQDYCMEYGVNILNFSREVMEVFKYYNWEGNVRELKNLIETLVILARNNNSRIIGLDLLPDYIIKNSKAKISKKKERHNPYDLNFIIAEVERDTIVEALKVSGGNKQKAAKLLNIPRSTLYFKMDKYNIKEEEIFNS